jgi:hypothetical protein
MTDHPLLAESLLPSCIDVAKRCNIPATIQQEGSHQSIRKQPGGSLFTGLNKKVNLNNRENKKVQFK